jgi:hypothetical protein
LIHLLPSNFHIFISTTGSSKLTSLSGFIPPSRVDTQNGGGGDLHHLQMIKNNRQSLVPKPESEILQTRGNQKITTLIPTSMMKTRDDDDDGLSLHHTFNNKKHHYKKLIKHKTIITT